MNNEKSGPLDGTSIGRCVSRGMRLLRRTASIHATAVFGVVSILISLLFPSELLEWGRTFATLGGLLLVVAVLGALSAASPSEWVDGRENATEFGHRIEPGGFVCQVQIRQRTRCLSYHRNPSSVLLPRLSRPQRLDCSAAIVLRGPTLPIAHLGGGIDA